MHESTRIEPSYVSVEARELKASSWPAGLRTEVCATSERKRGRGARRVRGEVRREEETLWLQSRSREELGGGGASTLSAVFGIFERRDRQEIRRAWGHEGGD